MFGGVGVWSLAVFVSQTIIEPKGCLVWSWISPFFACSFRQHSETELRGMVGVWG